MNLNDLADGVTLDAHGAPLMLIRRALIESARELCTETLAWTYRDFPVVVGARTPYPTLIAPRHAEVTLIRSLEGLRNGWDFDQPAEGQVRFHHMPTEDEIGGEIGLRPVLDAPELPDALLPWREGIQDGARYRLLIKPGVEWSNPELGQHYLQRFELAKSDATRKANYGHVWGSRRVRPQRFI